jgi:mitochondrial import inner membrane translocase subunit TIM10
MNFFGTGDQKQQGPDPVVAATTEMQMYTGMCLCSGKKGGLCTLAFLSSHQPSPLLLDLFNKIASSCFQKCTSAKHREPDLSLGEMTCTDRCVSKYLEAQERVGAVLQKANEAQLAQQQSMMEMQQRMGGAK